MSLNRGLLKRLCFGLVLPLLMLQGTVSAITSQDLQSIINNTPNYGKDTGGSGTCNADGTSNGGTTNLPGGDAKQKVFNYFVGKGLADVQAAAIEGNFIVESSLVPTADNGSHHGIAQWDYTDRYPKLKKYASSAGQDADSLGTQLDFVWLELQGTPPAGDYSDVLKHLKTFTSPDQIADATTYFQNNYEIAPGQADAARIAAAQGVLKQLGGTSAGAVTGSDSSCGSFGAVNCDSAGQNSAAGMTDNPTGGLSQVRQNVVCIAKAELAKWKSGQMGPGGSNLKYIQSGVEEEWCADFMSWVYKQAGYPVTGSMTHWQQAGALEMENMPPVDASKFEVHKPGSYVPVPGDMVTYNFSHVNMVVSVNKNANTMTVIGGNQGGIHANDQSLVSEYTINGFTGNDIHGYVSPTQ